MKKFLVLLVLFLLVACEGKELELPDFSKYPTSDRIISLEGSHDGTCKFTNFYMEENYDLVSIENKQGSINVSITRVSNGKGFSSTDSPYSVLPSGENYLTKWCGTGSAELHFYYVDAFPKA